MDLPIHLTTQTYGDGGNAPIITIDSLSANTTYSGSITLFNESNSNRKLL